MDGAGLEVEPRELYPCDGLKRGRDEAAVKKLVSEVTVDS